MSEFTSDTFYVVGELEDLTLEDIASQMYNRGICRDPSNLVHSADADDQIVEIEVRVTRTARVTKTLTEFEKPLA